MYTNVTVTVSTKMMAMAYDGKIMLYSVCLSVDSQIYISISNGTVMSKFSVLSLGLTIFRGRLYCRLIQMLQYRNDDDRGQRQHKAQSM